MKLSVVIPAQNEEDCIEETIHKLLDEFRKEGVYAEILVINDYSTDRTELILHDLCSRYSEVKFLTNSYPRGFGFAIRKGLENFSGDAVAIVMADGSDDAEDVMKFFRKLEEGFDSVFGSRFIKGGNAVNYPVFKLILNRLANLFIRLIFGIQYDDITNAFKLYRRETIKGLMPLLSQDFNITVELPLKTITRGYTYAVLPNTWINRKAGRSKFKLKKIGGHYLFIIFYCLIEKWFSIGNYNKKALNNMNYKGNSIQPLHSARRNK